MARRRGPHHALPSAATSDAAHPASQARHAEAGRVEAFSDGVFAIAITLLVLELRLPPLPARPTDADLLQALLNLEPTLLSYLISFLVIGSFWLSHHRFFRTVERVTPRLLVLNLLLLLCVSFLPFPTAVLGTYGDLAVAEDLYAASMALAGLCGLAMLWYADRAHLLDPGRLGVPRRLAYARALVVPLVAAVVVVLAAIWPAEAAYGWVLIGVLNVALSRVRAVRYP